MLAAGCCGLASRGARGHTVGVVGVIEVEALTKRYGRDRGCEDVSFEVLGGSVFGVLGPNGAGKSTVIRTLLDFQRPTSGRARLFGMDSRRDSVAIRRRCGYLPGDLVLFDRLSGQEHLRLLGRGASVRTDAVSALVDRFRIELGRPVRELSKGNRQKIGLLLALAHDPELVVLDEPTSGLDPLMQEEFHALLRELTARGHTVVLSSHVLDEVQRVADHIMVIREGRVVVSDRIDTLLATVPRRITLGFADDVDPAAFAALDGVEVAEARPRRIVLRVRHAVDGVVKAAAAHTVTEVLAAPPDLEELFLGFYAEGHSDAS
jgi:beta-exotoxin I transport system ATP-binding protein